MTIGFLSHIVTANEIYIVKNYKYIFSNLALIFGCYNEGTESGKADLAFDFYFDIIQLNNAILYTDAERASWS